MTAPSTNTVDCVYGDAGLPLSLIGSVLEAPSHHVAVCRSDATIALNETGTKLFDAGRHDEAMIMYDSAVQSLTTNVCSSENVSCTSVVDQRLAWGERALQASQAQSQSSFQEHPLDTYQEGECDVGPRPFRHPMHIELSKAVDTRCLQVMLTFNRALVHHAKSQLLEATETYALALYLLSSIPLPAAENLESSTVEQTARLGMFIHNNLGQIKYVQGEEEEAFTQFLAALGWAKQLKVGHDDADFRLTVANIMSNCCRTQWMSMNTSDDTYKAFSQVLRVRSSVLDWNHLDVAAAHYNLGVMEFVRTGYERALYHLEQYVKINSDRRKQDKKEMDVIPALAYILLIKNDNSTDEQSMELVRCLRLLLDKREEFGAVHSEVATILNYIGAVLFQRKELDYAIEFYEEELRVEQRLLGSSKSSDEPLSLAVTLNNIGRILQERGKYEEAIQYYRRALKTECRANKCGAELVASIAAGRAPTFLPTDDEAANSSTANLFATIWYNLGLIHDLTDSPKEAIWSFQMSLGLRRALLGPNHPDVACLWYNIGTLQMENNLLSQASASLRESLRIRRLGVHCQQNDGHIITTLQKLAALHQNRGNVTDAIEAYSQVLEIQRSTGKASKPKMNVGITLRAIAELQHASGDVDGALDTCEQSLHAFMPCLTDTESANYLACAEHVGTVMLSVGSLHHERCDPVQAACAYREAGRILTRACQSIKAGSSLAALLPLLDLSRMLAFSQCAPEA